MTAATIITGTVFSLYLLIAETGLVDVIVDLFAEDFAFISINVCYPRIGIVLITNVCCPPISIVFSFNLSVVKPCLVDLFGIDPNVVILIVKLVVVLFSRIGMNLPSSHNYIATIATTSMTSAKQCHQYNGL